MRVMSEGRSWDIPRSTMRESGEGVDGCEERVGGGATETGNGEKRDEENVSTQKWESLELS